MTRRGLTLIELIASLAIAASAMVVAGLWLRGTASLARNATTIIEWEHASTAVLDLLAEDLVTGDFDGAARIEVEGRSRLRIRTRAAAPGEDAGPAVHEYRYDRARREVRRRLGDQAADERVLVTNIADFTCELDEEQSRLNVAIVSRDGHEAARTYRLEGLLSEGGPDED